MRTTSPVIEPSRLMEASRHRYRAFVSYSHLDRRWGEWLHRALESYRVPQRLVGMAGDHGPVPRRLYPIFRDREELPTAGVLGEALTQALAASHSFILICSPAAARSRWVNEEVLQFKRLGGEARIYCLIVDGEPHAVDPDRECFPPALRYTLGADGDLTDTPAEPLAADARDSGDGRDNARLKIIAGLLGVSFGELRQRDLQARNRRLGIVAGLTTGMAALTIALAVQAIVARRAAEKSRQQGEDLIAFMLGDLRTKLEPLGKLDILDAVGDKAMSYFDQLDDQSLTDAVLASRAKALRQISEVRMTQGRPADASTALDAALNLHRQLAARHPEDTELQFQLAQTEYAASNAAYLLGQFDRSEAHILAMQRIMQTLVVREPNENKWRLQLAQITTDLGSLAHERFRARAAVGYFKQAVALASAIEPKTDEIRFSISITLVWEGKSLQQQGRIKEAIAQTEQSLTVLRELARSHPDDPLQQQNLSNGFQVLEFLLLQSGEAKRVLALNAEAKHVIDILSAQDSSNQNYRYNALAGDLIKASALVLQGHLSEGQAENAKVLALIAEQRTNDPDSWGYRLFELISHELAFNVAMAQNRRDDARAISVAAVASACAKAAEEKLDNIRIACARASMLSLELDPGATAPREAINLILARRDVMAETTLFRSVESRVQILDGQSAQALPAIQTLLNNHYRPLELLMFLRRHCDAVLAKALGEGCVVAVD